MAATILACWAVTDSTAEDELIGTLPTTKVVLHGGVDDLLIVEDLLEGLVDLHPPGVFGEVSPRPGPERVEHRPVAGIGTGSPHGSIARCDRAYRRWAGFDDVSFRPA
jgi:hypothetical protein